ncbi:pre-rRNA processing protein [Coemansia erecta]|uniref:Pre-rRNA processing protein n=1 Tax=Coemansia erecta TaxID=147472 RepID=A0A9W8CT57_9FUNG|nr:pre-rRNA processing protein [Coemansia erecta]
MDSGLEEQLNKLRLQINSKAAHQQQHAATLLAVEETIKEQHIAAEPASYFAALLTLLEQTEVGPKGLSGTIIFLLSIILPHVSANTLRGKFMAMMAVLSQSLDLETADVALLRSVISCLETVLAAQDAGSWGQPIAQGSLKSLLALATDSKPKIRKRAQDAVAKLMAAPPAPAIVHPGASTTAQFVLEALSNAKNETQAAMHTLQLVKNTSMLWPEGAFSGLCEALMQLPKLNIPFITALSFQALETVFSSASESLDEDQFRDLLIAIIDLKPNTNDPLASEAWLKIIQKGYLAYAGISSESCFQSLPDLIDLIFPDIELGKPSTREVATQCVWAMIRECIPDSKLESPSVLRIIKSLTQGLSYRYRESWTLVLLLVAAMFQRLGRHSHPSMDALMTEIANMRMEPEFELKNEADAVLGAAVRAMGPEAFLSVLPLNLNADQNKNEVGRAWLLPLMKGHVRNAPLQYFVERMLPLADGLSTRAQMFQSQSREIEAKVFGALNLQVWALFGGFCNVPSDIVESFTPEFAQRLLTELAEYPAARPSICKGLQTLLTAVHTIAHSDERQDWPLTRQQAAAAEQHMAQFAPRYLSELFNVFAQSPGSGRGFVMDTITAFLTAISAGEINATFVKVSTLLENAIKEHKPPAAAELTDLYLEANPPPVAYTMMDLATSMAAYLDAERVQMLLHAAVLLARQSEDTSLQKKGYKAICRLAEQPALSTARQLIEAVMSDQLIPMLIESAETVSASSRRDRLTLIASLSRNLNDNQLHVVPAMLSEAILGTKDVNERARSVAFETLLTMGRRMAQGGAIDMAAISGGGPADESMEMQRQANIEEFFKMAAAGLGAETSHMISATIAAISRILFEFHEQLSGEFTLEIMQTVLMFVTHNNREISKSSLGFVKVISVILPKDILMAHLKDIVTSILRWSHEYKNQMRLKCRHILDRLARRVGLDAVAKVTPEEHMKLIANMRKRQQRSKRNKDGNAGGAAAGNHDDDDDDHVEATSMATAAAAGKKSFGNAYEDVLYGSESELEDSDDESAAGAKGAKGKAKGAKSKLERKGASARGQGNSAAGDSSAKGAWIKEDVDGPLDFLDRSAFTHFATADPATVKARRPASAPKMRDGKLLFEDPEEEERKAKAKAAAAAAAASASAGADGDAAAGEDYYLQSILSKDGYYRAPNQKIKFHKRKPGDDDDDVEMASDGEAAVPQKAPAAKRGKSNGGVAYGREYRAKKAQGDVKRGSLDPFAYVPLNPKSMKKGALNIKGNSKKGKRAHKAK